MVFSLRSDEGAHPAGLGSPCIRPVTSFATHHAFHSIQVSENLDVRLAITFALSGRMVQAMLRKRCGAVRVTLLSAAP